MCLIKHHTHTGRPFGRSVPHVLNQKQRNQEAATYKSRCLKLVHILGRKKGKKKGSVCAIALAPLLHANGIYGVRLQGSANTQLVVPSRLHSFPQGCATSRAHARGPGVVHARFLLCVHLHERVCVCTLEQGLIRFDPIRKGTRLGVGML